MNTDNFLIEDRDLELARDICKFIDNTDTRNRAVANAVAANIAVKYFDAEQYQVDTVSGLHNIGVVLEDIDISDIYINNSYIDVRLFFDDDNLNIPKEHFDNNLLPAAYMFIKIASDISGAEVVGFALPENIDKSKQHDGFYLVDENSLLSFYDIESRLINVEDLYNVEEKEIFDYLDNKLENTGDFYRKLIASRDGRAKLAKAARAKYIFNFVSTPKADEITAETQEDNPENFDIGLDLAQDNDEFLLEENNETLDLVENNDNDSDIDVFDELNNDLEIEDNNEDEGLSFENTIETSDTIEDEPQEELEIIAESGEEPEVSNEITIPDAAAEEESNSEEDSVLENSFEFSTTATPSIETIEDTYEELLQEEVEENVQEPVQNEPAEQEQDSANSSEQQIEALFHNEDNEQTDSENMIQPQKPRGNGAIKLLASLAVLAIIGGAGYFGYSKFSSQTPAEDETETNLISDNPSPAEAVDESSNAAPIQEAMPVETVNTTEPKTSPNEGNAVSIPMIEQNLDASILVSNLKVDWEVPAGYASNTSAKRYLVKLGKIIQLNLKTELLLLSKPPLTNKIAVEIKYNNDSKKFETVGITTSSGEESVDQLIKQTVDKALAMNLNMNTNSFNKLQGNPVLVIRL